MERMVVARRLSVILLLSVFLVIPAFMAFAQGVPERTLAAEGPLQDINEYYSTQTMTYSDGTSLTRNVISGPPKPPPGYEMERMEVQLPEPDVAAATNTLTVPAYRWVFGCSAVSGSMIAGYYDRNGYPNMYTGPTNGGVMPLTEPVAWGTWSDGSDTYPNNPLIASHNGLDGRTTKGSIDDYWVSYGSSTSDPYVTGAWTQHTWSNAVGDYMKTSQSAYGNSDGSTSFWNYTSSAGQLTCDTMVSSAITNDGTVGRREFFQARGYRVTTCYNQKTDNTIAGGFSYAQYKAEIDAGRPVFLNLAGHSIVGVGYQDITTTGTVYVHDTWDNSNHTMPWGGSYSGMQLLSVSIIHLAPAPTILWRNTSNGQDVIWYMNGASRQSYANLPSMADQTWKMTGSADFDKDGTSDIIWRSTSTGQNVVWYMNGASRESYAYLPTLADQNWKMIGFGDFDADGKPDIVWRNTSNGQNVVWYMNGASRKGYAYLPTNADLNWKMTGVADYNNDGKPDLFWRNTSNGQNVVWYMNGASRTDYDYLPALADQNWKMINIADYDADGKPDIVWRNTSNGQNVVWYMNGASRKGYAYLPTLADQNWKMVGGQSNY